MQKNVAEPERWLSVIAGSAIAAYGLKLRSVPGLVLAGVGGALVWRGATGHCHIYEAMGISSAPESGDGRQVSVPYGKGVRVEETVTIDAAPERVYAFWRNFENLPQFMHNVESVKKIDEKRSHWVVRGPAGTKVEWDAEIINEIPNELIGWRSLNCAEVDNAGSVHFEPSRDGRSTELRVILRYDPPAGVVGAALSKLLGEDPAMQVEEDLLRLKMLLETGRVSATGS
ncbi:MAG: SRPBCC family protein [Thermoanaerobaculia bacterium]